MSEPNEKQTIEDVLSQLSAKKSMTYKELNARLSRNFTVPELEQILEYLEKNKIEITGQPHIGKEKSSESVLSLLLESSAKDAGLTEEEPEAVDSSSPEKTGSSLSGKPRSLISGNSVPFDDPSNST